MSGLEEIARMVELARKAAQPAKVLVLRVGSLRYEWLKNRAESGLNWRGAQEIGAFYGVPVVVDETLAPMDWEVGDA